MTTKRLLIQVLRADGSSKSVLPVNTGEFVDVNSELGIFSICVYIRNFDGAQPHRDNSLYNPGESQYLNATCVPKTSSDENAVETYPNLRISVKFTPKHDIDGSELLFGNDCPVPVTNYIPTSLISTGLKFFSWAVNSTIKSDLYSDHPYIYGLALSSFTKIGIASMSYNDFLQSKTENLDEFNENIPTNSMDRRRFFSKQDKSHNFVFRKNTLHYLIFDTNYIGLEDSQYNLRLPAFGSKTFTLDVGRFANETLNNFNWTIKSGTDAAARGEKLGMCLNFALRTEQDSEVSE